MPRKIREKKQREVKDRTEEFQDWFLLQSRCRLECREPSRLSGDPEERTWANWIHSVRYASGITAAKISVEVDWILQSCGCVRKGVKRFFPEDPSCPVLIEDLTRKSVRRRRKTGPVHDDLLTATTRALSGPPGKFDLSTPYDDLPLQYRKMYDAIRPFVKDPSNCEGWDYDRGIRPCNNPPLPGSNFCQKCRKEPVDYHQLSAERHGRIMSALRGQLLQIWRELIGRYSSEYRKQVVYK